LIGDLIRHLAELNRVAAALWIKRDQDALVESASMQEARVLQVSLNFEAGADYSDGKAATMWLFLDRPTGGQQRIAKFVECHHPALFGKDGGDVVAHTGQALELLPAFLEAGNDLLNPLT